MNKLIKNHLKRLQKDAIAALLVSAVIAAGCERKTEKEDVPIDIPFTEFLLQSCQWSNLDYDGKVIIINDFEELAKYTSCQNPNWLIRDNKIDFASHTLLLASGSIGDDISFVAKDLQQLSENKYAVNVEILLNKEFEDKQWRIAILTDKLAESSSVGLKVKTLYEDEPKDVDYSEYLATWTYWWQDLPYGAFIINSKTELEKYMDGDHPDIDFSKHTLIWARGFAPRGIYKVSVNGLQQLSANYFKLEVDVSMIDTDDGGDWIVVLITKKISGKSNIKLITNFFPKSIESTPKSHQHFKK